MEGGRGKALGSPFGVWVAVSLVGGRYPFLFGLCFADDFRGFLDRLGFALYQLCQGFKECIKLFVCHAFFHFLFLSASLIRLGVAPLTVFIIPRIALFVNTFFENI